jgi:hypothetical protein
LLQHGVKMRKVSGVYDHAAASCVAETPELDEKKTLVNTSKQSKRIASFPQLATAVQLHHGLA